MAIYCALSLIPGAIPAVLLVVIALADIFYPLFDARRQTLHDKFVGTLVVVA
ncbi:MAG: hypothetical protein ACRDVC_04725 [Acidimicrobiales bacterium]